MLGNDAGSGVRPERRWRRELRIDRRRWRRELRIDRRRWRRELRNDGRGWRNGWPHGLTSGSGGRCRRRRERNQQPRSAAGTDIPRLQPSRSRWPPVQIFLSQPHARVPLGASPRPRPGMGKPLHYRCRYRPRLSAFLPRERERRTTGPGARSLVKVGPVNAGPGAANELVPALPGCCRRKIETPDERRRRASRDLQQFTRLLRPACPRTPKLSPQRTQLCGG